jgi:hypothetical protein
VIGEADKQSCLAVHARKLNWSSMLYQALVALSNIHCCSMQWMFFGMLAAFDGLVCLYPKLNIRLSLGFQLQAHGMFRFEFGIWPCPNLKGAVESGLGLPKSKGHCGFSVLIEAACALAWMHKSKCISRYRIFHDGEHA